MAELEQNTEVDSRFPSGRWVGQYIQFGQRTKQELSLVFSDGVVEGGGNDPVGWFAVKGTYDILSGRVRMSKRYPGMHTVEYDGTAELKHGIWGLWEILMDAGNRGGFQLWPLGMGQGTAEELAEEAPIGREVIAMPD